MKPAFQIFSLSVITLLIPFFANAQTTAEYFSRPGLNINAFNEYFGDTSSASYTYSHKKVLCGDTVLVFALNNSNENLNLFIDGDKVYKRTIWCEDELLYNFGLQVGQKVLSGYY
ncbi:MAG TPA: hypothetical protein VFV79_11185, partial [Saprospiraceae bacterium]|nr:hypothetical protein [Saprospiraceae bacterium]